MSEELSNPLTQNAGLPPAAAVPVQPIRFCGICGAASQTEWAQCESCVSKATRKASAGGEISFSEEKRSIARAIALYASLLAISAAAILVSQAQGGEIGVWGLGIEEAVFVSVVLIWSLASWKTLAPSLTRIGPVRWLAAAPLMAIVTFIVASLAVGLMQRLLGMDQINFMNDFSAAGYGLGLATLFIAVQPAIFEELAFRGMIFDSLRKVAGSTETILASAAMFAILHLSIPSFLHLMLMGVMLGWLRNRTGSLYPCMLLHFTHNFLCVLEEHMGGILPW